MNLVRDVLDQQVIDSKQRKAGKVDGIALEIRDDGPPRVAYLDIGTNVLARRLWPHLERWMQRFRRRLTGAEDKPFQIPWRDVKSVAISVTTTLDAAGSSSYEFENWLREHIISRIPGSAHKKHQHRENSD